MPNQTTSHHIWRYYPHHGYNSTELHAKPLLQLPLLTSSMQSLQNNRRSFLRQSQIITLLWSKQPIGSPFSLDIKSKVLSLSHRPHTGWPLCTSLTAPPSNSPPHSLCSSTQDPLLSADIPNTFPLRASVLALPSAWNAFPQTSAWLLLTPTLSSLPPHQRWYTFPFPYPAKLSFTAFITIWHTVYIHWLNMQYLLVK